MAQTDNIKLISNNKKAYHDFFIEEKFEAGMELYGTEIKSVRMGNVNLKDSWISIKNLEAFSTPFSTPNTTTIAVIIINKDSQNIGSVTCPVKVEKNVGAAVSVPLPIKNVHKYLHTHPPITL